MSEKEQREIFQENLLALLNKKDYSQNEVAKRIGVSPQTFNTWCRGIAIPRMSKIQKLADFFGVDKSQLLDEQTKKDNEESIFSEVDDMTNELFEKHKLLFSKTKNASVNDMKKIIAIVDTLMGENDDE